MNPDEIDIALNRLVRSPFNVRSKSRIPVASLASSIHAHTLLQKPLVHPMGRKKLWGVADGWRRCSAIQLLCAEGKVTSDVQVRCKLITADEARALSLAANIEREPMHPADEYEAFRLLHEDGHSIEKIAADYGVAPLVVTRRLRLANLAPRFIAMFHESEIDIDQLMALSLTDDHAKQEAVWDSLSARNPSALRAALTRDEVDAQQDRVALYVGRRAYEDAGGPVRLDLFSEDEGGYLQDVALLHQLAQAKLDNTRLQLAEEGWAWTEARIKMEYLEQNRFGRLPVIEREVTVSEAERLGAIRVRMQELEAIDDEDLTPEQHTELWELQDEHEQIRNARRVPDPRFYGFAGAVVIVGDEGRERIIRGLVRPEDRKRFEEALFARKQHTGDGDGASAGDVDDDTLSSGENAEISRGATTDRSGYSEKLLRNLTAHATLALQVSTARNINVALAALAYPLVLSVFSLGRSWQAERLVKISHVAARPERDAPNLPQSRAFAEMQALRASWEARIPGEDVLGWLLQLPQDEMLNLIAFCTSTSIDCVGREIEEDAKLLAKAANLDMTQWWCPDAEGFLAHVPKATIVRTVTEACDAEKAAPLAKAKKDDAVRAAEQLLAGSGWVPPVLRL